MDESGRRAWVLPMVIVAVAYAVIGIVFAVLDDSPDPNRVHRWRLAAWVASAVVAAAHLGYERFRLGNSPRPTALHAAAAVALGAFGLAVAANIHELGFATGYRPRMLIALVAWPLVTAVPAFVAALTVAAVLGVKRRGV